MLLKTCLRSGALGAVMALATALPGWANGLNFLTLDVLGHDNTLEIVQTHIGPATAPNTMTISITGNANGGHGGGWHRDLFTASGLHPGRLEQSGWGNTMALAVVGDGNLFGLRQVGSGNTISGTVTGYGNAVAVAQLGTGNTASFSQTGHGNAIMISQRSY